MQNVEFCKSLVVSTLAIIYKSHFTKEQIFLLKQCLKTNNLAFFVYCAAKVIQIYDMRKNCYNFAAKLMLSRFDF